MKEDIYDIIAEHLTTKSRQPNSELSQWLKEHSNNRMIYNSLRYHWIKGDLPKEISGEEIFERISKRISAGNSQMRVNKPNNNKRANFFLKIAAVVALAVTSVWVLYNNNQPTEEIVQVSLIEKATEAGQKNTFTLSDGTIVKLNANSRIEFPSQFDSNKRAVSLDGEAFFEVVKNPDKPFIVQSGSIETRVLGTSFNVDAHVSENEVIVAVVSGKVQVTSKNNLSTDTKQIVLSPNEMVTYDKAYKTLDKQRFSLEEITGWKDGVLVLKDADAKAIQKKLQDWYGVRISFENKSSKEVDISANYYNEPLENVLKSLSYTLRFDYKMSDKNITIKFLNTKN